MTGATSDNHDFDIMDQLQNIGEEYGIVLEPEEKLEAYAHRVLEDLAQMIGELTDAQKNVLALIA